MAKNVIITEDGHSKTISNATRIRTALESGGTCDWIPKDDVPLQELTVTEDGVYNPDEGYYGFSQVTANGVGTVVEGMLIEKTVTKNGTYNITDESGNPYGYSKITVNVDTSDDDSGSGSGGGGSNLVVGKDEDGNDTMAEADDDGNIVMTALPTEIKVIIPPTKLEYNRYEEIDYSGISVYAYISKAVHWLGTTTTAVSEGSSNNTVSIGGNSIMASVGDGVLYAPDRTGANDIQLVWDGTKWVKPSNYSAEKAVWKSNRYPTGKIPFEELIFKAKRVNDGLITGSNESVFSGVLSDGTTIKFMQGDVDYEISCETISAIDRTSIIGNGRVTLKSTGAIYHTYFTYGNYFSVAAISARSFSSRVTKTFYMHDDYFYDGVHYLLDYEGHEGGPGVVHLGDNSEIFRGIREVGIRDAHNSQRTHYPYIRPIGWTFNSSFNQDLSRKLSGDYKRLADSLIEAVDKPFDKEALKTLSLPVQWKRPGDGKILETTFTAWMKDEGDNNTSGGNTRPGGPNIDVPQ